jgi:hypothetical protein
MSALLPKAAKIAGISICLLCATRKRTSRGEPALRERHAVLSGMRFLAIATVLFCLGVTSTAQAGDELITAQDTVLCLRGQDVVRASDPKAARNQASLRALRCMRPRPFALFR